MSNKLVQKLANKFVGTHFQADKLEKQKEVFEHFYYENVAELKSILNEMSGDLWILKEKNFPLDLLQLLGKVFQQLLDLYKDINPKEPYSGTLNLVNWANSKTNKAILENLDFLIQKHLEKNEINFYGKDNLKQARVSSITHLLEIVPKLKQFMLDNPSLEGIRLSELVEDSPPPSGPDDPTKAI